MIRRTLLATTFSVLLVAGCTGNAARPVASTAATADPTPPASLVGTAWAWQQTLSKDGRAIVPDAPLRYTLEFLPGNRVNVRADCNRGAGPYQEAEERLSFGPVSQTRMKCPRESKDRDFLQGLAAVTGYRLSRTRSAVPAERAIPPGKASRTVAGTPM